MIKLEGLHPNTTLRGILPDCLVSVVSVQWFGSDAWELTYKDPATKVATVLLYRHDEVRRDLVEQGRRWSFDGDGALSRLVCDAHRICLARPYALFDREKRARLGGAYDGLVQSWTELFRLVRE